MKTRIAIGSVVGFFFGALMAFIDVNGGFCGIPFASAMAERLAAPGVLVLRAFPRVQSDESVFELYTFSNAAFYALVGALLSWLFWRLRSSPSGIGPQCSKCGYCLIGNTSGVCPECGNRVAL